MITKPHLLTPEGLEKLTAELRHLSTVGREEVAERLQRAFQDGQDDDFVAAMADANGADLAQFKRWYAQAGTPTLTAGGAWDGANKNYTLTLSYNFV